MNERDRSEEYKIKLREKKAVGKILAQNWIFDHPDQIRQNMSPYINNDIMRNQILYRAIAMYNTIKRDIVLQDPLELFILRYGLKEIISIINNKIENDVGDSRCSF